jgi:non-specific serine/threonine protein kinase
MDLLAGLVRQSIVVASPNGRFRQLQPLREYGLQHLRTRNEVATQHARHCSFVDRLAAEAAEDWFGRGEVEWLDRVRLELPNIRAALTYCSTPERAETGLRIVTNITRLRLPFFATLLGEFCAWFETLLALAPDRPTDIRVGAVAMLGWIHLCQGDQQRARTRYDECVALVDRQRHNRANPAVVFLHGTYQLLVHGARSSIETLHRARETFATHGATGDAHMAGLLLALAAGFLGTEQQADEAAAACLADAETHRAPWAISWARWSKGLAERRRPDIALPLLQQCLTAQIELHDGWGTIWCVEVIAWLLASQQHGRRAAELLGGAMSLQHETGVRISGLVPLGRERQRAVNRTRAAIGGDAYNDAYKAGMALTTEEVYALALTPASTTDRPATSPPNESSPLTDRQRQIARLVAEGLSNKEIANALVISQRTVENHLGQVFTRLGAHNRAQVAAWITHAETT